MSPALAHLFGVAKEIKSLQETAAVFRRPESPTTMGRGRPPPPDPASGHQAAASDQQHPNSKRQRLDGHGSSVEQNARLLAKNKFATLPVDQNTPAPPKPPKVPPIFASTKEVAALRNELAKKQIHPLFKLCSTGTKIVCTTVADYQEVGKFLVENRAEFYTHDAPGNKPLKVLLRGLEEYSPEEIIQELKAKKLKPLNVFPIRRGEGSNQRDRPYLVHLEKGSISMKDLREVKALFQIIVEWERYRPKKRQVTQCGNCLAYGHGTKNCHMRPRCGKCAGEHSTDSCAPMQEGTSPKCVNCGDTHEGNNRACPKRAEYIEIRRKASAKNQRGRVRPPPPPVTEGHFPPLPPVVPTRNPSNHQPVSQVQQRLAAAASAVPEQNRTPPGWGNQGRSAPTAHPLDDGTLYPPEVVTELAMCLFERLGACRSKREQINAVTMTVQTFLIKYGP